MLWIHTRLIQGSRDQLAFDQSPELIAVFHALHRLLAPRHPPHALSSLAALIDPLLAPLTFAPGLDKNPIKLRYRPVRAFEQKLVTNHRSFVISNDAYRESLSFHKKPSSLVKIQLLSAAYLSKNDLAESQRDSRQPTQQQSTL